MEQLEEKYPKTIGELKELIKDLPNDYSYALLAKAMQKLKAKPPFIYFEEDEPTPEVVSISSEYISIPNSLDEFGIYSDNVERLLKKNIHRILLKSLADLIYENEELYTQTKQILEGGKATKYIVTLNIQKSKKS